MHERFSDDADRGEVEGATLATVLRVLGEMGIPEASEDAVLTAPPLQGGSVLLTPSRYAHFNGQMAFNLRFIGYPFDDVAFLSVRQFCEMYVRDSFPPIPSVPLSDEQHKLDFGRPSRGPAGSARHFPICFVLGSPRSGTTLLRAMLNTHSRLWSPGELHFANFSTMADRAHNVEPVLRYMPIPECALRCGESVADFGSTFRGWELARTPVTDVYQHLHDADRSAMIVDKSPPYSAQPGILDGIGAQFSNAKFVHLVRSPHDVVRSYVRMQFQRGDRRLFELGRNPYQAGEAIWYACNVNAETFLAKIGTDRHCTIRYEELTSDPARSLKTICDLLNREFEPEMADPYSQLGAVASGAGDLHVHLHQRVEHRSPSDAFFELGRCCQEMADRYGY
jgi:hypothetical protein